MKKVITTIIVLFTLSILFIGLGSHLLRKERNIFISDVEHIFVNALALDLEKRLKDSGMPYFFTSTTPSIQDQIGVQTGDSISYVTKDSTYINRSLWERQSVVFQTALIEEGYPLQVQDLDSIFTDKLHQIGYHIHTGVRYMNNQTNEIEESDPDHLIYMNHCTPIYYLGLSNEISIQGFYDISYSSIFHRAPLPFILLFIAWLITITGFTFLTLRKKRSNEISYVSVSDISKTLDSDPVIQVSEEYGIYFDPVKSRLYYPTDKFIELSNQPATLFLAFLEAPEHFLTYKQIDHIFWPKQEDTRAVRAQAIKRLREDLSPATLVRVDNINRNGYKLVVVSQE